MAKKARCRLESCLLAAGTGIAPVEIAAAQHSVATRAVHRGVLVAILVATRFEAQVQQVDVDHVVLMRRVHIFRHSRGTCRGSLCWPL